MASRRATAPGPSRAPATPARLRNVNFVYIEATLANDRCLPVARDRALCTNRIGCEDATIGGHRLIQRPSPGNHGTRNPISRRDLATRLRREKRNADARRFEQELPQMNRG